MQRWTKHTISWGVHNTKQCSGNKKWMYYYIVVGLQCLMVYKYNYYGMNAKSDMLALTMCRYSLVLPFRQQQCSNRLINTFDCALFPLINTHLIRFDLPLFIPDSAFRIRVFHSTQTVDKHMSLNNHRIIQSKHHFTFDSIDNWPGHCQSLFSLKKNLLFTS